MIVRIAMLAVVVAVYPLRAMAWGTTAHQIVAIIAEDRLTPEVAREVKRLLHGKSMSEVAAMPDLWASKSPEQRAWHFVDIPLQAKSYDQRRDCVNDACLVKAVRRFESVLADRQQSDEKRQEALIYLIHLIADAHAPLHTADNHDRGGNDVRFAYGSTHGSLHSYWDTGLLALDRLSPRERALRLLSSRDFSTPARGNIESWVNETHTLATQVYARVPKNHVRDPSYERWSLGVVDSQLLLAAARLQSDLIRLLGTRDFLGAFK
jgi:nuclease S1